MGSQWPIIPRDAAREAATVAKTYPAPPPELTRPAPDGPRRAARGIIVAALAGTGLWLLVALAIRFLLG